MSNVISALTARTQLGQILKRASESDERFLVDRRGQPSVIIMSVMSVRDYMNTVAPPPKELRAMQDRAKRTGLNKLSMRQIDKIISEVRTGKRIKRHA